MCPVSLLFLCLSTVYSHADQKCMSQLSLRVRYLLSQLTFASSVLMANAENRSYIYPFHLSCNLIAKCNCLIEHNISP